MQKAYTKAERVEKERRRLKRECKGNIPEEKMFMAAGLIDMLANYRVMIEDMQPDLVENGTTELFSQSEKQTPYTRVRPIAESYIKYTANYSKLVGQLNGLFPKGKSVKEPEFESMAAFAASRDG